MYEIVCSMPKTKKPRLSFVISEDTKKELEKRANDNYRSVSQEIRSIIEDKLNE